MASRGDYFPRLDPMPGEGLLSRKRFQASKMPPTKDCNTKQTYARSYSNNGMSMSARVYHPATNLMPLTPPQSPTGMAPTFGAGKSNTTTFARQNSNGKYS